MTEENTEQQFKNLHLLEAVENEELDEIKRLLKEGADPNAFSNDHYASIIDIAIWSGSIQPLQLLIDEGADINTWNVLSITGSPLFCALTNGNYAKMECLVKAGADLDAFGDVDLTALHHAVQYNSIDIVELLLEAGANPNIFDKIMDFTPLHYAVREEKYKVVELLLKHGADVNANCEERIGETPLGDVADTCCFKLAKVLIDAGANPMIEGWMKLTALDRASERKSQEGLKVYELLRKASGLPPTTKPFKNA